MKKLHLALIIPVIFLISSCGENEFPILEFEDFFRFESTSSAVSECATEPFAIPVYYTKNTKKSGSVTISVGNEKNLTYGVNYTLATLEENGDFTFATSPSVTLTFGEEEYIKNIYVVAFDDNESDDGDAGIKFAELTMSSSDRVGFPDANQSGAIHTVNVLGNDFSSGGVFNIDAIYNTLYNAEATAGSDYVGPYESEVLVGEGNQVSVTNLGGMLEGPGYTPTDAIIEFSGDAPSGTITVSGSTGYATADESINYGGNGTYFDDGCVRYFTINWQWVGVNSGGVYLDGTAEYTMQ